MVPNLPKCFPEPFFLGASFLTPSLSRKSLILRASEPLKCVSRLGEVQKSPFPPFSDSSQKKCHLRPQISSFLDTFAAKMEHGPLSFRCRFSTPFFGNFWPQFWTILAPFWSPGPPILAAKIVLGASLVSWPPDAPNTPPDPIFGEF